MGDIRHDDKGTFVVKRHPAVIVSQMHRSPGVFFDHDKGRPTPRQALVRGPRDPHPAPGFDFEFDAKESSMSASTVAQAAGDHLPLCLGHGRGRDPDHLLRRGAV